MGTLRTRKDHLGWLWQTCGGRRHIHLDVLPSDKLHAGTSVLSAAPVPPEQRLGTNDERMQQDANLTRLCCGVPIPLALLTERAGTTTVDAGPVDYAQTSISFSSLLVSTKFLFRYVSRLMGLPQS